jgi:hypothetical protein
LLNPSLLRLAVLAAKASRRAPRNAAVRYARVE